MYIAIDFDGTVVTHEYPNIGKDIGAIPVLQQIVENGHKIILNTMRSKEKLTNAVNWFKEKGIPLFGINNNPTQKRWTTSPKVYAHLYIDDSALGIPLITNEERPYVNWIKVEKLLKQKGII